MEHGAEFLNLGVGGLGFEGGVQQAAGGEGGVGVREVGPGEGFDVGLADRQARDGVDPFGLELGIPRFVPAAGEVGVEAAVGGVGGVGEGAAGNADAGEEEGAAEGGKLVEEGGELEEVAGEHAGGGDAHFEFEAEGFEGDAGLRDHLRVGHGRDGGAVAGVVFAEALAEGDEGAGVGEGGFDLADEEAGELDDLFEGEGEGGVGVEAGDDVPDGDLAAVSLDHSLDVFVGEVAEGVVVVLPDEHPVGDVGFLEVDEGAGDDGKAALDEVVEEVVEGGGDEVFFAGLDVAPVHGDDGVVEALDGSVSILDRLDSRIHAAAEDVAGDGSGSTAAAEKQFGVEGGKLFADFHAEFEGFIAEEGGFGGLVGKLGEGVGEGELGFFKLCGEAFGAGVVEEVPVLHLLEDAHEAAAGEFDVEDVGLFALFKAGGFEDVTADGGGGFGCDIPKEGEAHSLVVGAGDDQEAVPEIDISTHRYGFDAQRAGADGRELVHAFAVAINLEPEGHGERPS